MFPDDVDPVAAVQGTCATHEMNPAAGTCERCGDFMCRLCTTRIEGRLYCPRCFDLLYHRGALQVTQQQFTLPGLSLALAGIGFCLGWCPVLGFPLAIGGLAVSLRALKEIRSRPGLSGQALSQWALGLSIVTLVSGAIFGALWILAIIRSR
jgi:ABC-type multidrug transport system permease subunit